jgi:hypothetical protein
MDERKNKGIKPITHLLKLKGSLKIIEGNLTMKR